MEPSAVKNIGLLSKSAGGNCGVVTRGIQEAFSDGSLRLLSADAAGWHITGRIAALGAPHEPSEEA
jgi:hypothetical protein